VSQSGSAFWQARGQSVLFLGYARYWKDLDKDNLLPELASGQSLTVQTVETQAKQTQPPPRYTEAKLVQVMEKKGVGRPSTYAATVKTLKERGYTELQKKAIWVTERGMQVDEFMQKTFPDLLLTEFTAEMESALDAIAQGKQDWQKYICQWNQSYFDPALQSAKRALSQDYATTNKVSEVICTGCQQPMLIMAKSAKMQHDYLKCFACQRVMFWNDRLKSWESPDDKPKSTLNLTEYPCPVCKKPLAIREYSKDGQSKKMLICSASKGQSDKRHKEVVFFESKGVFWSKKYGELAIQEHSK
jgi:DNA topoisomerase-1